MFPHLFPKNKSAEKYGGCAACKGKKVRVAGVQCGAGKEDSWVSPCLSCEAGCGGAFKGLKADFSLMTCTSSAATVNN